MPTDVTRRGPPHPVSARPPVIGVTASSGSWPGVAGGRDEGSATGCCGPRPASPARQLPLPYGDPTSRCRSPSTTRPAGTPARGLPLRVHVDLPRGLAGAPSLTEAVAAVPVGAELLSRGHVAHQPTLTMVAASADVPAAARPARRSPGERRRPAHPRLAAGLRAPARRRPGRHRAGPHRLRRAAVRLRRRPRRPVAVARMSVEPGWAGCTRCGSTRSTAAAASDRRSSGPSPCSPASTGCRGWCCRSRPQHRGPGALRALGFTVHHTYAYVDAPAQDR